MDNPLIAILTDFGTADPFVGVMKGVICRIAPGTDLLDLTHEIPPGDIRRGAIVLLQSAAYFPENTIFLCVVDPGVGTDRRAVLVQCTAESNLAGRSFIGPDNGLFTLIINEGPYQARQISSPALSLPNPSNTFHGRDLFAPAAAHLAAGYPAPEFGPRINDLIQIPFPRMEFLPSGGLLGEILYPDRFGNLLTSLGRFIPTGSGTLLLQPWLASPGTIERQPVEFHPASARLVLPNGQALHLVRTFGEIPEGMCAVLVGSSGLLEIAANHANASEMLHLPAGGEIRFEDR